MHGEHPVLVIREVSELTHVLPHPLVGGVEEMGAITMDLDTGSRFGLGIGVAADVPAPIDHKDPFAQLGSRAFGDRQTEESRADDDQVIGGHLH